MITNQFADPIIQITSASTISEKRQEDRRAESVEKFLLTGTTIAGIGLGASLAFNSDRVRSFFSNSIMDATIQETAQGRTWQSLFSDGTTSPGRSLLEGIRKAEELSPFRILRTLQLSHALTPALTGKDVAVDISPDLIRSQEKYFSTLLKNRGQVELSSDHLRYGLRLEGGRLYEKTKAGGLGQVVAKEARLMLPHFALPKGEDGKELIYANKILKQYSTLIGGGETDVFNKLIGTGTAPFMVVAGESRSQISFDLFRSYARNVFAQGAKVWDNPFEQILEYAPVEEGSKWHNRLKRWGNVGLGTGGRYRQSVGKSVLMMAKNQGKLLSAVSSYFTADFLAQQIAPEDSAFSKGLIEGIATMAVNTHLAFAELWSDKFQGYKEAQEYYAPGSTELMTMLGTPLALGTAAATGSYVKRLYDNGKNGIEISEANAERVADVFPEKIKKFMPTKLAEMQGSRMKRWAAMGALAGLALEAPFIPGALIGESSEKLQKEYSGEEDVAVRANRWWFTGSGKFGGDHIKYFDKGSYARMMAGTETKSKYGDAETERALNPIIHPFDYLRDPYKFEKMHADDRPYPVWGMDVSTGSFLGKLYEKTIGAIIKPDIINPRLAEELSDAPPGTVLMGGSLVTATGINRALDTDTFSIKTNVSEGDASLIAEGKLIAPAAATLDPNTEAATWSWEAFKDFVGLKGWLLGEAEEAMSIPSTQVAPQLARSGEMTNAANTIRDANLGGLFGLTEPQRRYIPTSANVTHERVNPLKNAMPDWLPGDDDSFFLNFQKGDPYTTIEHGASRLPGLGYESLFPVLEGVEPNKYPDIFKMKILSDVAMGSESYYGVKNRIEKREEQGGLTNYETRMLKDIRNKEFLRSEKRQFSEYKTEAELEGASTLQKIANAYWEAGSHNLEKSLPSEFLTFFRPAGKLVHQRTAIEDYERTQLEGSDQAIWTKPIDHFIKPALVSARRIVQDDFITDDVQQKRDIDQYFDTLEYVKQRKIYQEANEVGDTEAARTARAAYQRTTEGALASGLDTDQEVLRSYISLSKADKPYFSAFVNAQQEDRERIQTITPERVADLYKTIWSRKDIMDKAVAAGATAEQANVKVQARIEQEELVLRDEFSGEYKAWLESKNESKGSFREHLTDVQAQAYLKNTGGMPGEDFSGWDPRIDMNKIKLRALTIGGEDFFKFGFWKDDVKDLQRYTSVNEDEEVQALADNVVNKMKEELQTQDSVEDALFREGYIVKRVITGRSGEGIDINVETN